LFFLDMANRAGEKFILGVAPVTKPGSRESQRNIQNDQRQGRDLKDGCHGFAKIGHQPVLDSPQGWVFRPAENSPPLSLNKPKVESSFLPLVLPFDFRLSTFDCG